MRNRNVFTVLAVFALFFGLCPVGQAGEEPETIRFGVCLSMSGEFHGYGPIHLAGISLLLNDFNSRSGEHGMRLEMILRDDKSDPEEAARIVDELASEEKVSLIIGGTVSSVAAKMVERASANKVVLITPSATSPAFGYKRDWSIKILTDDIIQGSALARFIAGELGLLRTAVIYNDYNNYGPSLLSAFSPAYEDAGGEIVAEESYQWDLDESNVPDLTGILLVVKEMKPDVVFIPGYADDASTLIYQSLMVNFSPVFCGGDSWTNQKIIQASGNNVEGSYYVGGADMSHDSEEGRRFIDLYDMSNDPYAEESSVNGYDSLLLFIKALETDARSGQELLDSLYDLGTVPLAAGRLRLDPETGTRKTMFIHKIVRDSDVFTSKVIATIEPE
jgi:ABC-type branched-chain amino acid transport systems, periplasmic component